jgi:16S rRNA (uracil1498-N3)-methyltransferase
MAHLHRFFIAQTGVPDNRIIITGPEAHHALHVVRLRVGEETVAFDGRGHLWRGRVHEATREALTITVDASETAAKPLLRFTLCLAWLHRDKPVEAIIRMGTEIGVNRFVFFDSERSQRPVKHNPKWHRLAIESCKQCGRLWLPEFATAQSLRQVFDHVEGKCFIATKTGAPLSNIAPLSGESCTLIVGPEGDFTKADLATATKRGAAAVSLGAVTYRAEVAALVLATLFKSRQGEFGPV